MNKFQEVSGVLVPLERGLDIQAVAARLFGALVLLLNPELGQFAWAQLRAQPWWSGDTP